MATSLDIVNRALTEIAARQPLTALDTSTAAGLAAVQLYTPAIDFLLRQQDWEFARRDAQLSLDGGTPPLGWSYQYLYPSDCVRVRQVRPQTWNEYEPYAVTWDVGDATISAVSTKVIWTNEQTAYLVYTTNDLSVDQWDPMFQEQAVRYLGSLFAMPVGGRPDFSREFLQQAGMVGNAGKDRDS